MSVASKYFKIFTIGISELLAWRAGFFMIALGMTLSWVMLLIFWQAVYAQGNQIGTFTLRELLLYYTFMSVSAMILDFGFIWDVAFAVHEGALTQYLVRPISYLSFQFARELGYRFATLIAFLLPITGAIYFFWNDLPRTFFAWFSILLILGLGFFIVALLGFIVAMGAVHLKNPYTLPSLFFAISALLSGRTVPLSIMPSWLRTICEYSPFPFIGGTAADIILGNKIGISLNEIVTALAWIAVLIICSQLMWKHAAQKYEASGV